MKQKIRYLIKKIKRLISRNIRKVFILLAVVFAVELILFISSNSVDRRFVRDLARGLESGWELDLGETELQDTQDDAKVGKSNFVELEYNKVKKYKNAEFKNKKLGKLAKQYIEALEGCRYVINRYDMENDFDNFWVEFSPYYGQRIKCLYAIYDGGYRLRLSGRAYEAEKDNLIVQGWILKKSDKINFKKTKDKDGDVIYRAKLKNDSGYNLEYVNLDIYLYDEKDKIVDYVSAYDEDIKSGDTIKLEFYLISEKATAYEIVAETCEIKTTENESNETKNADEKTGEKNSEKSDKKTTENEDNVKNAE